MNKVSTAGAQPLNGRQYLPGNNPNPSPSYANQDIKESDAVRSHTRDPSRGRGPAPGNGVSNIQTQQHGIALSPRSQSSAGATRSPAASDVGIERQPSVTQGHHQHYRQTSRAQGTYLQARSAAFASSPATSPLSPETSSPATSSSGVPDLSNYTMINRGVSSRRPTELASGTAHGSLHSSSSSTLVGDQDMGDLNGGPTTQRRLDRTQSVKGRRGHDPQRSQSRHSQEQKSVGEYALHHLFNKVSEQLLQMTWY